MDFDDTPEEAAFRTEARTWLEANAPRPGDPDAWAGMEGAPAGSGAFDEFVERCKQWQRTLSDGGWACLTWPKEYGGQGLTSAHNMIFNQEVGQFGVTLGVLIPGLGFVGPTIIAHGSDEQKARYLPPLVRADEVWCQLFSEPGAGSDLANLRTKAERDGDEFVVTGQKVWNSFAHVADYGILLARTNPDVPKHKGISFFLVDMRSPGIEIRPIRQINGAAKFNEVFLDEVRIPASNVLGEVDGGWAVTHTTLMYERGQIGATRDRKLAQRMIDAARAGGTLDDPVVRQAIARAHTREQILRYFSLKLQTAIRQGKRPGAEASLMKLLVGNHLRDSAVDGMMVAGLDAVAGGEGPIGGDQWKDLLLWQYEVRFGGGTEEIQRNTIGESVLGLPREERVDKDLAFRDVKQSG